MEVNYELLNFKIRPLDMHLKLLSMMIIIIE